MSERKSPLTFSDIMPHGAPLKSSPASGAPALPLDKIMVVRREDLLFLIFQFFNLGLKLLPSGDAVLERINPGAAHIIVHFPQQSIAEQAVFQAVSFTP